MSKALMCRVVFDKNIQMHTINIRGKPYDIVNDKMLIDIIRWLERFIECNVVFLPRKYTVTDDNKSLPDEWLQSKVLPAWKSKCNDMSCVNYCVRLPYIGSFTADLGPPG